MPILRDSAGSPVFHLHTHVAPRESGPSDAVPERLDESGVGLLSEHPDTSMIDRLELIERLKRSNSPSWQQHPNNGSQQEVEPIADPLAPKLREPPYSPVNSKPLRDAETAGLEIDRPQSALHTGDFRERKVSGGSGETTSSSHISTSPVAPWNRPFPATLYRTCQNECLYAPNEAANQDQSVPGYTLNSFALLPPTSPLARQANNVDSDLSPILGFHQGSKNPEKNTRRYTFSPTSPSNYQPIQVARSVSENLAARHSRQRSCVPCQAHQPGRVATFNQSQPQTPYSSSRRPSFSEASPLQHAHMVGSYEESILRGRMSTTPSKPLGFVAKIGVLGKGKCKSSLKCPPHVTVPFPAVFYSYDAGNGRILNNEPSPYVGLIDLENSLAVPDDGDDLGKRRRSNLALPDHGCDAEDVLGFEEERPDGTVVDDLRKREKKKRRSISPRAPPGGCYRIPAQGQLQVVLKNPNKTAVKLFLVPYDLSNMEPGQKTFIRQRSYSAGPIIETSTSAGSSLDIGSAAPASGNMNDSNDRPRLRYLIHLHICCPSKNRYYLYKSIRVVFANRVPDEKERMLNEIQFPEPRFSTYKPARDATLGQSAWSTKGQGISKQVPRRRSVGLLPSGLHPANSQAESRRQYPSIPPPAVQFTGGPTNIPSSNDFTSPIFNLPPVPFSLIKLASIESRPISCEYMETDADHPLSMVGTTQTPTSSHPSSAFEKLSRDEIDCNTNTFSHSEEMSTTYGASLLSQGLLGIGSQQKAKSAAWQK